MHSHQGTARYRRGNNNDIPIQFSVISVVETIINSHPLKVVNEKVVVLDADADIDIETKDRRYTI